MTAVRGAGFTGNRPVTRGAQRPQPPESQKRPEDVAEDECRRIERQVQVLLDESIFAQEKGDFRRALERAKEAGRQVSTELFASEQNTYEQERQAAKKREQLGLADSANVELTFHVLFNLAHQYTVNDMLSEALNTYQVVFYAMETIL